jgi:hypothetical protein
VLQIAKATSNSNIFLAVLGPARTAEFEFLMTGSLPKSQNHTFLTIYHDETGNNRGPIADPYTAPIGPLAGDMIEKVSGESLCIQFYHNPIATLGQGVTCHAMTLPSYPMCLYSLPLSYFIYVGCSIPG